MLNNERVLVRLLTEILNTDPVTFLLLQTDFMPITGTRVLFDYDLFAVNQIKQLI